MRTDGDFLGQALRDALGAHPHVGDIRGRGFFWGVELVADRASKAPFDPAQKVHARLKKKAMELGLLCYPFGGTVDGHLGDHVLLASPYIATRAQLESIAALLAQAVDAVTTSTALPSQPSPC